MQDVGSVRIGLLSTANNKIVLHLLETSTALVFRLCASGASGDRGLAAENPIAVSDRCGHSSLAIPCALHLCAATRMNFYAAICI